MRTDLRLLWRPGLWLRSLFLWMADLCWRLRAEFHRPPFVGGPSSWRRASPIVRRRVWRRTRGWLWRRTYGWWLRRRTSLSAGVEALLIASRGAVRSSSLNLIDEREYPI